MFWSQLFLLKIAERAQSALPTCKSTLPDPRKPTHPVPKPAQLRRLHHRYCSDLLQDLRKPSKRAPSRPN